MIVQCRDVFSLPSLQKATVVAGRRGLNRALRWVQVLEVPDAVWAQSGDLLLLSGIGLTHEPLLLTKLIRDAENVEIAGLAVALGPYIKEIPEESLDLADTINLPLFTLPWDLRFGEISREVINFIMARERQERFVNQLLEAILFGQKIDDDLLANQINYCGYDFWKPHQVVVLNLAGIHLSNDVIDFFNNCFRQIMARHDKICPFIIRSNKAIILLTVSTAGRSRLLGCKEIASDLLREIAAKLPECSAYIGIGSPCNTLVDIRRSFEQAVSATEFALSSQSYDRICAYEEMGIYKLLTAIPNKNALNIFSDGIVEPLYKYDEEHGTNIIENILAFLEENGNVVKAAKRLYVHRNTLQYRLQKVEELTGLSLEKAQDRLSLHIALLCERMFRKNAHHRA